MQMAPVVNLSHIKNVHKSKTMQIENRKFTACIQFEEVIK